MKRSILAVILAASGCGGTTPQPEPVAPLAEWAITASGPQCPNADVVSGDPAGAGLFTCEWYCASYYSTTHNVSTDHGDVFLGFQVVEGIWVKNLESAGQECQPPVPSSSF